MGLVEFLLARIGEDEKAADRAVIWRTPSGLAWIGPTPKEATLLAISGHRLLAECAAKRRIVELYSRVDFSESGHVLGGDGPEVYWDVLRLLALPYADHPDYDPAWNPEATQ